MSPKMLLMSAINIAHRHTPRTQVSRLFIQSSQHMCTKVPASSDKPAAQSSLVSEDTQVAEDRSTRPGIPTKKLTMGQKRYVLLAFKHKTIADVPDVLTVSQIDGLYQRARITVNLLVGLLVLILCIGTVITGKQRAARGDTLDKNNLEWHRKNKEEHLAAQAVKLANSAPSQ